MKFMTANEGPTLRISLKVSKLKFPWLKAIIVKACGQHGKEQKFSLKKNHGSKKRKNPEIEREIRPGTSELKRSKADGNFDISEEMCDAQQKCFYQSVNL